MGINFASVFCSRPMHAIHVRPRFGVRPLRCSRPALFSFLCWSQSDMRRSLFIDISTLGQSRSQGPIIYRTGSPVQNSVFLFYILVACRPLQTYQGYCGLLSLENRMAKLLRNLRLIRIMTTTRKITSKLKSTFFNCYFIGFKGMSSKV